MVTIVSKHVVKNISLNQLIIFLMGNEKFKISYRNVIMKWNKRKAYRAKEVIESYLL